MQLHTKRNRRGRREAHRRPNRTAVDPKPLRVEISDEEILADLLYPAPVSALERRR
jgi:hypothetical protein